MKFLIDEGTGAIVSNYLKSSGYDAVYIGEKFSGKDDRFILNKALRENRIVITMDKDFGDLVFFHNLLHKGIILLRLRDERVKNRIKVINRLLIEYRKRLPNNFVVATDVNERIG